MVGLHPSHASGITDTLSDFGIRETVSAPPASAIDHNPPGEPKSKDGPEKAKGG